MSKKRSRSARFAEGDRVWSLAERDRTENDGDRIPEGVVLKSTKKADGWWYTVQLKETDRIVSREEGALRKAEV